MAPPTRALPLHARQMSAPVPRVRGGTFSPVPSWSWRRLAGRPAPVRLLCHLRPSGLALRERRRVAAVPASFSYRCSRGALCSDNGRPRVTNGGCAGHFRFLLSDPEAVVQSRTCLLQEARLASPDPQCAASIPSRYQDTLRLLPAHGPHPSLRRGSQRPSGSAAAQDRTQRCRIEPRAVDQRQIERQRVSPGRRLKCFAGASSGCDR